MKKPLIENVSDCFYKGLYKSTLDHVGTSPLATETPDYFTLTSFQIGALVFSGDFFEAEALYRRALSENPSEAFLARGRFFLGIGHVRRSEYAKASSYFATNLVKVRNASTSSEEIIFYAYQGAAFFSFFKGQFAKTQKLAHKAYSASYSIQFEYGQVLALDLLGHANCQIGEINRGLLELEKALKLSKKIGNGGISTALQVSLIKYRSQFGHNLPTAVQDLETALQKLNPEDTYSKSELYLELVRQLLLRGQAQSAQKILEAMGSDIYRHQNKRQSALYNFRFAYFLFLKGEPHAALALTNALRQNLDPQIDKSIYAQANGLDYQIKELLGHTQLKQSQEISNFIDLRIRKRQNKSTSNKSFNQGEDPLGDLLDRVRENPFKSYYDVKAKGLYGILPKCLNLPVGKSILFIGPSRSELLLAHEANVVCIDKGVNGTIKKLIISLQGGRFKTKEQLIKMVWGYEYNPQLHDPLLYATIGKLRNILGSLAYWVESSSDGYKLIDTILVRGAEENSRTSPVPKSVKSLPSEPKAPLNMRQLKFLQGLKRGEFISVREYAKRYRVTTMTACRDLTALHKVGRVLKIGRGRATVYSLQEDNI